MKQIDLLFFVFFNSWNKLPLFWFTFSILRIFLRRWLTINKIFNLVIMFIVHIFLMRNVFFRFWENFSIQKFGIHSKIRLGIPKLNKMLFSFSIHMQFDGNCKFNCCKQQHTLGLSFLKVKLNYTLFISVFFLSGIPIFEHVELNVSRSIGPKFIFFFFLSFVCLFK